MARARMPDATIDDVADTALWIAAYRAQETNRERALFKDPLAARLAGKKGARLAETMTGAEQFHWMTAVRTVVVDDLVLGAVRRGVGTVLSLGAGLDTRTYRLSLPSSLKWIEVDLPRLIRHKDALLEGERASCSVQRIAADLSDATTRREVFARVGAVEQDVLVLTEGVLAYLTTEQAAALADDIHREQRFTDWIIDYSARFLNRAVRARGVHRKLKNAPLRFAPLEWETFFRAHGWRVSERRDLPIEGEKLGRPLPLPWWFGPVHRVLPRRAQEAIRHMIGYARLERM